MSFPCVGFFGGPRLRCAVLALSAALSGVICAAQPWRNVDVADSHEIKAGDAVVQVDFARGDLDLSRDVVLKHIQAAIAAITAYYGRFPVAKARLLVIPTAGRDGVLQGTTWGGVGGWPAFTRIRLGQHTTEAELAEDWTTTHEMVHMAFPSMPDDNHWMEEGQATYIEPVARVMTGELKAADVWHDMMRDMPKGEPGPNDQGLDRTHSWANTYWGGGLFCLVADVEIRRETGNTKGLEDALRAVVAAGGTIDQDWDLPRALAIGDKATGTQVLSRMYAEWKDKPTPVDLPKLWGELGVRASNGTVEFDDKAPLAKIREAITAAGKPSEAQARGSH